MEPITVRSKRHGVSIIKYCRTLKLKQVEYSVRDQLLRAGTSIGANIIEGQSSSSLVQLIRYYEIALRSAEETKYWIEISSEAYELELPVEILKELSEITKILASIIKKLKIKSGIKQYNKTE